MSVLPQLTVGGVRLLRLVPQHLALCNRLHLSASKKKTFEPDYLDSGLKLAPRYGVPLNVQLKGFDYHILESYQSYVHNLAENVGVEVSECWATPPTTSSVKVFAPGGTTVRDTFMLDTYERNVQLKNVSSTDIVILLDILKTTLPEGVDLSVHQHDPMEHEERALYVTDPFIDQLRAERQRIEISWAGDKEAKEQKAKEKEERKRDRALASLLDEDDEEEDEDEDF